MTAPFVPLRTDLRKDERVLVLAEIAGYNRQEAIGRLFDLWSWCTDRKLADAPAWCDGYAVAESVVRRFLGPLGVEAILANGCDELSLGRRVQDDLIYLRGTSDQVARRRGRQKSASAGGTARALAGWRPARSIVGSNTTDTSDDSVVNTHTIVSETTNRVLDECRSSADECEQGAVTSGSSAAGVLGLATVHRSQTTDQEELRLVGAVAEVPRPKKQPVGEHASLISEFDRRYRGKYGTKYAWGAKDGKIAKDLLARLSLAEVTARIAVLFDSPPDFLAKESTPPDMGTLLQFINRLAPKKNAMLGQQDTLDYGYIGGKKVLVT